MLAALVGGPALGQPPAGRPQMPARDAAGGARPPGAAQPAAARPATPAPGASKVVYYQKPADSTTATGGPTAAGGPAPAGDVTPASAEAAPPLAPVAAPDNAVLGPALPPSARPTELPAPTPIPDGQPAVAANKQPGGKSTDPSIPLPDRRYIFEMYDDAALERAVVQSIQKANPNVNLGGLRFPGLPPTVPVGTPYVSKTAGYEPQRAVYEPLYVVHRRLHFEEKNTERYGWDLGILQPFVSTAYFYKDALLWPNSLASGLEVGFWDTSAGKCLPGSPVPYYLYPPGLTITGMLFEGGVITGTGFILSPVKAAAPFVVR